MIKTKVILPITIVVLTAISVLCGNVPASAPVAAVPVSVDETQAEATQVDAKREANDNDEPSVNAQVAEDAAGIEPNPQQKRGLSGNGYSQTGRSMKRRRPVSSSSSSSSSEEIVHHSRSKSSHAQTRSSGHQSRFSSSSSESDEHGPRIHRKFHDKGRQFFYPAAVPVAWNAPV